jgi:quercetin dioxygenase-like cupin family protein
MTVHLTSSAIATVALSLLIAGPATAQLMTTCAEDSPERRGEQGCTIIVNKALPSGLRDPQFWNIYRFASLQRAQAAAGAASVAFDAGGISWLIAIESQTSSHRGGKHVAQVGPLPLPPAAQYRLQVQTAAFTPGMYSLSHQHSGVEAVYVIEGEACYETPDRAVKIRKGETLALPAQVHRAVVTGSALRRILAIIVHDAAQPATTRREEGAGPPLVACK